MMTVPKTLSNIDRAAAELGFAPGFISEHMMAHAEAHYPESEAELRCDVAINYLNSLPFAEFEEMLDESWTTIFTRAHTAPDAVDAPGTSCAA